MFAYGEIQVLLDQWFHSLGILKQLLVKQASKRACMHAAGGDLLDDAIA
jgi:hypothetical protein